MQPDQRQNNKTAYPKWAGFGIEFGGVVAVFCAIGYWLDQKYNTSPWFLLSGFFLAFIGMFYNIWKQTRGLK